MCIYCMRIMCSMSMCNIDVSSKLRCALTLIRQLWCALIGVPCRLSMLSTFSTFADVLCIV